jgi:hypothetical protein
VVDWCFVRCCVAGIGPDEGEARGWADDVSEGGMVDVEGGGFCRCEGYVGWEEGAGVVEDGGWGDVGEAKRGLVSEIGWRMRDDLHVG